MILRVESDIERQIQTGLAAGPLVTAVAGFPDAGKVVERAFLKVDPADAVGSRLGKIEPALGLIQRRMVRQRNASLYSALAVSGAARLPVPPKRLDVASR